LALTVALVLRTFLSIKIADINGTIVQSIVNLNFGEFVKKVNGLRLLIIDPDANRDSLAQQHD
jgi:hypothetical protein